ncbi:MAG: excinuclease ABC subunit UvrC, partial [Candidatus Zixiibacteriota bacterium]
MSVPDKELKLKLKNLPTSPGVYLFRNAAGKIIYIGKAKNLRNRVRTYFQSTARQDVKTHRLVSQIRDVELMVTANEIESLILEANLVREHKPRYNVNLKDDKHFPYIKITTNEPFPQVLVVRRLENDGATYFGPYTSAKRMRRTLNLLTRLFRIRTCTLEIPHPQGETYKPCLDYQIHRCGGPCAGLQTQEEYRRQVDAVIMALSGKSNQLISDLTARMEAAAAAERYEEAREIRDQIRGLESLKIRQHVDVGEIVDRDIIAVARDGVDAVAVVMQIRQGVLLGRQDFRLTVPETDTDTTLVETFVEQYYNKQPNLPEEVFLPLPVSSVKLLQAWLTEARGGRVRVVAPRRGDKVRLMELAQRNARLLLDELLLQKRQFAERTSKMVVALQEELKLPSAPRRMVCFDISNTGTTDAVGSCVFFEDGRPKKSEYRHFRIKGVEGQDDFHMMREVVGRYFYRCQQEEKTPPDLVVLDGGKGQLSAALAELQSLGMTEQPVIALAKRLEEVFLPGRSEPVTIGRSSPALMLLKRIRDEAHRFAVSYNRKVRAKRTITSGLDSVPGVGPARRQALLQAFGSVERVAAATVEELTALRGISPKLAQTILRHLKATTPA